MTLRALMLLVAVTAMFVAWKANRARSQRKAVEAIKLAKGSVNYDFAYTGDEAPGTPMKATEPPVPKWLRKALGDEYFQEVTFVAIPSPVPADIVPVIAGLDHLVFLSLNISQIKDTELAPLATIPSLRKLAFTHSAIGDAGLEHVGRVRKLDRLSLYGATRITDAGMTSLAGLNNLTSLEIHQAPNLTAIGLKNLGPRLGGLETLIISHANLSDDGMDFLDDCRKLKTLMLGGEKIGDASFAHFRNLESLERLNASMTEVTDDGLVALQGLTGLQVLGIAKTRVTGKGLRNLDSMTGLTNLMIQDTKVDDSGLDSLRKLTSLKVLFTDGSPFTPEAIAALQAELPSVQINPRFTMPIAPRPAPAPK